METTLSVAELESDLADALERVRGGARVVVEQDGRAIAVIVPPAPKPGITWRELAEALRDIPPVDEDFAKDIAEIRAAQQPVRVPEWPD